MNIKIIVPFLLLLINLTQLSAQEKMLCADCIAGKGCTFYLGPTKDDIDITIDGNGTITNSPAGSIFVIATTNSGTNFFLETKRSRAELDMLFGGDGFTQISLTAPGIQPVDGQWKITTGEPVGSGCILDGQDIKPQVDRQLKTVSTMMQMGKIIFSYPFQPKQFLNSTNVKWMMIAPNTYKGVLKLPGDAMKFHLEIKVINKMRVEGSGVLNINIPGQDKCTYRIPVQYVCLAADKLPEVKTKPDVPLIEDNPKPNVPLIEDESKPHVPYIKDEPKPNVPIIKD